MSCRQTSNSATFTTKYETNASASRVSRRTLFFRPDLFACAVHHVHEPARHIFNESCFSQLDGFFQNQLSAHTQCGCASEEIVRRGVKIYSARGNQWDLRQWALQRLDVTCTAHLRARKYLHEVRTGFPRCQYFSRCQRTGHDEHIFLDCKLHSSEVESWADEKLGSRLDTPLRRFRIQDGTR